MVERQIDRQWSTSQFFVMVNATLLGVGFVLVELGASSITHLLRGVVGLAGLGLAVAGIAVLRENKRLYRTLVAKKTLLEHELGFAWPIAGFESHDLATHSLGAAMGQRKVAAILKDPTAHARAGLRIGSASDWARWTLFAFAIVHVAVAGVAFLR